MNYAVVMPETSPPLLQLLQIQDLHRKQVISTAIGNATETHIKVY